MGHLWVYRELKIDLVKYPHPRIADVITDDGVRIYADDDLAGMKIQAILGRGKKKDFWDLNELLRHHALQWMMDRHGENYPNQMLAISVPHALSYFVDAEESEEPMSLKGQTWEGIKSGIARIVNDFLK